MLYFYDQRFWIRCFSLTAEPLLISRSSGGEHQSAAANESNAAANESNAAHAAHHRAADTDINKGTFYTKAKVKADTADKILVLVFCSCLTTETEISFNLNVLID